MSMIEERVQNLGLASEVFFLGQRTDISDLLSLFDIYVLSTHTEGVSISLLEAMAMQLPVIATAVGGNVEVVEDRHSGFLSKVANVNDLANHLVALSTDREKASALELAARERVENAFSLAVMTAAYHSLYCKKAS